jgi:hypothetical protein
MPGVKFHQRNDGVLSSGFSQTSDNTKRRIHIDSVRVSGHCPLLFRVSLVGLRVQYVTACHCHGRSYEQESCMHAVMQAGELSSPLLS